MERKIYKAPFILNNLPDWPCPTCAKGILSLAADTFEYHELKASRDAHVEEDWEPEWIEYAYTCRLVCTNPKCAETVFSVGTGSVDWYPSEVDYQKDYYEYFRPAFFVPSLRPIKIPNSCPRTVARQMEESFRILFSSPSAAVNKVRAAIEELLTEKGVNRWSTPKGRNKRTRLNLHQRIALLPDKYSSIRDMALAIKWLGNAGSHGHGEVTIDDALDCYEFAEHLLEEVYGNQRSTLKKRAQHVIKRKGRSGNRR